MSTRRLVITLTIILFLQESIAAQIVLHGVVVDALTGNSLPSVVIRTSPTEHSTQSSASGTYELSLPAGEHVVAFSYVGYLTFRTVVALGSRDSLRLNVSLDSTAVQLDEVTVIGQRTPLSTIHGLGATAIIPEQVDNISGAFGDIYRTIQSMPGVQSNNELSGQFHVRGGAVDENLVLLNGTPLIEAFHLKEAPTTSLSIINVALLKKVLFVPGGFTARYGDRLSSVLDLELREGSRDRVAGQAEASLTDGSLVLEGPISPSASFLSSLRMTYSGYIARYLPDGDRRDPSFYDLHGNLSFRSTDHSYQSLQLLHAADKTSGVAEGGYSTTLLSGESKQGISEKTEMTFWGSYYDQREILKQKSFESFSIIRGPITTDHRISQYLGKIDIQTEMSETYSLRVGSEYQQHSYALFRHEITHRPQGDSISVHQYMARPGKVMGYAENLIRIARPLLLNVGFRLDYARLTNEIKFSPRILASYRFENGLIAKVAWGLYYQTPTYHQLFAASRAGTPPQSMQRAVHYIAGIEKPLRKDVGFRVEMFHKELTDLISFVRRKNGELIYSPRNDAIGFVRGIDAEMRISDERVMVWVNGALMEAKEWTAARGWQFRSTDQRKTVTTVFEYRVAETWVLNLRAFYGSGFAYVDDRPGFEEPRQHYPDYKRVDARISYSFPVKTATSLLYLEVMNVFDFRNAFSFAGQPGDPSQLEFNLLLPRVLNVGIRVKW